MSAEAMIAAREKRYLSKWTAEVDALIESMINDGISFLKIASKLVKGIIRHHETTRATGVIK
jgi:hypothetical protein